MEKEELEWLAVGYRVIEGEHVSHLSVTKGLAYCVLKSP